MKLKPQGIINQTYKVHERDSDRSGYTELHKNLARSNDKSSEPGSCCQVAQERGVPDFLDHALQGLDLVPVTVEFRVEFIDHKYMFGIQITINRGGNIAVSRVILIPNMAMTPTVQLTQISTINRQKLIIRKERKNR